MIKLPRLSNELMHVQAIMYPITKSGYRIREEYIFYALGGENNLPVSRSRSLSGVWEQEKLILIRSQSSGRKKVPIGLQNFRNQGELSEKSEINIISGCYGVVWVRIKCEKRYRLGAPPAMVLFVGTFFRTISDG